MNKRTPSIIAPCRTYRRAAFRRVAGGALPERGRGVEEINHGRTPAYAKATAGRRTTLTNVRVLLDKGERRCTCGEAVRLPEAEGRAAKRSQEAARGVFVLVCGFYERLASVPMCVAGADEHCTVHYCKYVNLAIDMFIDDAIRSASSLPKTFKIRWEHPEAFFRNRVAKFWEGWKQLNGLSEIVVPSTCDFSCLFSTDKPHNGHALTMGVFGPFDAHRHSPLESISASIFSTSLNESSSSRHSPFSNCLREMAMALASSAFSRHIAISSQVLSKSATLIITLVLRPFCVMTIGRCVRAVRAKQSLSVRRYSVNGTTSSSRRGRWIGFVFVRITGSPFETKSMVHYSVPHVKGGSSFGLPEIFIVKGTK